MLQRKNGATLSEIMETMGWQKHTVRGFMAGAMKKAGYTIESFKPEGGERNRHVNCYSSSVQTTSAERTSSKPLRKRSRFFGDRFRLLGLG
jgi:hypothetical protein